jgi:hypothetical protein
MDPYNTPAAPQPGSTTDTEPTAWAEPIRTEPVAEPATEVPDEGGRSATAREWMTQLQGMIDNLATHAAPVMREIGAKAAELAAAAGEKAGPFAQRAAEATAQAGSKVAERGREVAAELRRDAAKETNGNSADPTPPVAVGAGGRTTSDTAETVGE